jgi:aarF domain-containing kinase
MYFKHVADLMRSYTKTLKGENWDDEEFQRQMAACHKRCAERSLRTMEKNGSIFIKLGQHLSSLHYLLPEEWCTTFIPLQDRAPVSSYKSVEQMFREDTGSEIDEIFAEFDRKPIGAASLAQVHVARLRDTGEQVAVKIQHPSLDEWAKLDMWLTSFTFKVVKYFFPEYDLLWLGDEMQLSLPKEMDFREEAKNANRTREYFKKLKHMPLVVPEVRWAQRRILVMEYLPGHRTDDLEFLDSNGISRDEVSASLARIFNEMIFGDDCGLHCDPHGGNIAVRINTNKPKPRNFDIILYDHGLYRDIPQYLRRAYAHMWLAVLDTDIPRMRKYAKLTANIGDEDFPIFASAITGRDYNIVTSSLVQERNADEKRSMTAAIGDDLVEKLVGLLSRVPRVILLILKTNDLTRSLDEGLQTKQGPVRSFMILARHAALCVYKETLEGVQGSWLWPSNFYKVTVATFSYAQVALKLTAFETYISMRRRIGV